MTRRARRDFSTRAFLEGVVDALWLPAWMSAMSAMDEARERLPRNVTRQTAEPAPISARRAATRFMTALRGLNHVTARELWRRASAADGREVDPEELGYYLTMQAQDHGVGWEDRHERFQVRLPSVETYVTGSPGHWHLTLSGAGRAHRERLATEMDRSRTRRRRRGPALSPELQARVSRKIRLLRREGKPADVAAAIAYSMARAGRLTARGGYKRVRRRP